MMRRFAVVSPGLYRSGRYSAAALRAVVAEYAIRRVIDLRDRPEPLLAARTYRSIGVAFMRWPIDENADLPDGVVNDVMREPHTLVHCWKGSHRTGAVIASVRLRQGWSMADAWDEMMAFDFGSGHVALRRSVFGDWSPAC